MCALFGVIGKQDQVAFEEAFELVAHRGREKHLYTYTNERYAYARLPTDGLQVASTTTSRKPLLFLNGIIYNVSDLHARFALRAHSKESDTLTLREGLLRHGTDFVSHCRGMFAYAFITEDAVELGRDTIGIKPLFYGQDKERFAFSSELKGLVTLGFRAIREVSPGERVLYHKKTRRVERSRFVYKQYLQNVTLEKLLHDSLIAPTKRYLLQSRTQLVGVLVSGGLDSSILFSLLAKELSSKEFARIVPVCVGSASGTDKGFARKLARAYGKDIVMLPLRSEAYCARHLKSFVRLVESPYARAIKVAFIQDVAAEFFAKRHIDIVISGEGADELFYGYPRLIVGDNSVRIRALHKVFLKDIFPKTLLQRLDRVFSARTIEARVPFLDQELVAYAEGLLSSSKYAYEDGVLVTKRHLRLLAKDIGLPAFLISRPKVSMTLGATGRENTEQKEGYLEKAEKVDSSIADTVRGYYNEFFGQTVCGAYELSHDLRHKELEMIRTLKQEPRQEKI